MTKRSGDPGHEHRPDGPSHRALDRLLRRDGREEGVPAQGVAGEVGEGVGGHHRRDHDGDEPQPHPGCRARPVVEAEQAAQPDAQVEPPAETRGPPLPGGVEEHPGHHPGAEGDRQDDLQVAARPGQDRPLRQPDRQCRSPASAARGRGAAPGGRPAPRPPSAAATPIRTSRGMPPIQIIEATRQIRTALETSRGSRFIAVDRRGRDGPRGDARRRRRRAGGSGLTRRVRARSLPARPARGGRRGPGRAHPGPGTGRGAAPVWRGSITRPKVRRREPKSPRAAATSAGPKSGQRVSVTWSSA